MRNGATRTWAVTEFDAQGVTAEEHVRTETFAVTVLRFATGARLGRHPAGWWQRFAVLSGTGWVAGEDGVRRPVAAGDAVEWLPDEPHESGSDAGMVALVVQAAAPPTGRT